MGRRVLGARGLVDVRIDAYDASRVARLDVLAHCLERGTLPPLKPDLDNPVTALHRPDHRASFADTTVNMPCGVADCIEREAV